MLEFAIGELRAALGDTDPLVRVKVAEALWIGRAAQPRRWCCRYCSEPLKDKNPQVRAAACGVIGQMGTKAKHAIPTLIDIVKDKDVSVVIAAISALGDIGPSAHRGGRSAAWAVRV